jgi:hypothetical protein
MAVMHVARPPRGPGLAGNDVMSWVEVVLILAAWVVLQVFVLPRLGVPT